MTMCSSWRRRVVEPCLGRISRVARACFAPSGRELLSFASPKESSQRKGDPGGAGRFATALRCSRASAAAQLAPCGGSDSARRLPRDTLRFSAAPTGAQGQRQSQNNPRPTRRACVEVGAPVGAAEQRRTVGGSRRALSEPMQLHRMGELRSRPAVRVAQGSRRRRPTPPGSPSFGYFSWRSKKSDSPVRAKSACSNAPEGRNEAPWPA